MSDTLDTWATRITVTHSKRGKTLLTGILHVEGNDPPPVEALFSTLSKGSSTGPGQVTRRPDEAGKQVYWVNVLIANQ